MIVQISDIHIGGEYGGKFDCRGNLEKVLADIKENVAGWESRMRVVVSGDLCDRDAPVNAATPENYLYIDGRIRTVLGVSREQIVYIPGNHDDAKVMGETLGFDPEAYGVFYVESENPIKYPNYAILTVPTHTGKVEFPAGVGTDLVEAEAAALKKRYGAEGIRMVGNTANLVFSHFPIGPVHHRFMENGHSLDGGTDAASALYHAEYRHTFCGHYHIGQTVHSHGLPDIHVCPSVQCQLDPYTKSCTPIGDYPGYALIELTRAGKPVVTYHFIEA